MIWVALAAVLVIWWADRSALAERLRLELSQEFEGALRDLHEQILDDIEVKRAERQAQEAELCRWLLQWNDHAHECIAEVERIKQEFEVVANQIGGHGVDN